MTVASIAMVVMVVHRLQQLVLDFVVRFQVMFVLG